MGKKQTIAFFLAIVFIIPLGYLLWQAAVSRALRPAPAPIPLTIPLLMENTSGHPVAVWANGEYLGSVSPGAAVSFDRAYREVTGPIVLTAVGIRAEAGKAIVGSILVPHPNTPIDAIQASWGGIDLDRPRAGFAPASDLREQDALADAVFEAMQEQIHACRPGAPVAGLRGLVVHGLVLEYGVLAIDLQAPDDVGPLPKTGYIADTHGMLFVRIPAGNVSVRLPMQSTGGALANITAPFYMSVTEITQTQYEGESDSKPDASRLPATEVTWHEADDWCDAQDPISGWYYSLPTWAQWELACQSGRPVAYSPTGKPAREIMWYALNSGPAVDSYGITGSPQPIAMLLPNDYGLFDMHGNVQEWCIDWFDGRAILSGDNPVLTSPPAIAPPSWSGSHERVRRGGGYSSSEAACRCGMRDSATPNYRYPYQGFRPILEYVGHKTP